MRQSLHVPFSICVSPFTCSMNLVRRGLRALAVLAVLSALGVALQAQTARIVNSNAGTGHLRVLPNHLPQWANAANDAGIVPANQPLDQMTVVLARSQQQQLDFEKFLADQQDPASPVYHHWLTPAEVGVRFGPRTEDVSAVTGWLKSQGLQVNWVAPSGLFIGFGGTAGDLARAFHTSLHTYKVNGVERLSVESDPMIPEALAPTIKAVRGLYTIEERPAHQMSVLQSASPNLDAGNGVHFMTDRDFATIYDGPSYGGNGITIGIVARSRTDPADFDNFKSLTYSTFADPTEVIPTSFGGVDPGPALTAPPVAGVSIGDQSEATLDVLRAGGVAPGSSLLLVAATSASGGIGVDAQYLVQSTPLPAQVMTISFGACESAGGPSGVDFWDTLFQQAAAEGISSFVSSGDAGASGCDTNFSAPPASPQPNSPNYICSSSYVTCVGGTEFADTSNPATYWGQYNNDDYSSALGYIPEGAWNEPLNGSNAPQAASSGGGVSAIIPTPAWQTGTGVPAARTGRYTPDVSFSASQHDAYFACLAASGASCVSDSSGEFEFVAFSGTSATAPAMAGITALVDSGFSAPQGNMNPELYQMAVSTPTAFHDVTVATSGVSSCDIDTPSMCNNSLPSSTALTGGQPGYLVTPGFDLATGLGSLDIENFLSSRARQLITPTVTITPAQITNIVPMQSLSVTISVAGNSSGTTPTGSVFLSVGSLIDSSIAYISPSAALVNGSATIVIPTGNLRADKADYSVQAKYTPDAASVLTYAGANNDQWIYVKGLDPGDVQTLSTTSLSTTQPLTVSIALAGVSGYPAPTGSFSVEGGDSLGAIYNSTSTPVVGGQAALTIPAGDLVTGNDVINGTYTPDTAAGAYYTGSTVTTNITVTSPATLTPTVTLTPSQSTVMGIQQFTVTIVVNGGSGNPMPTGTVTLTCGASYGMIFPEPLSGGSVTFNVSGQDLFFGGPVVLTAAYTPDPASISIYKPSSGSVTVTYFPMATPTVTVVPSSANITTAQAITVAVTVSGPSGEPTPTGTVTLYGSGFNASYMPLAGGTVTVPIPAGTLVVGTDQLYVIYSPDTTGSTFYSQGFVSTTITVTTPLVPKFTITGSPLTVVPGATTGNTMQIAIASSGGFTGSVALSAIIVTSPAGATVPTLSFGATTPVSVAAGATANATLTVTTTAPTSAALHPPTRPGIPWYPAGSFTLACLILFGIPARRRNLRSMLGMALLLTALAGGVLACGGGGNSGGSGGGGSTTVTGTTAGTYSINISGISGSEAESATITLIVQ